MRTTYTDGLTKSLAVVSATVNKKDDLHGFTLTLNNGEVIEQYDARWTQADAVDQMSLEKYRI